MKIKSTQTGEIKEYENYKELAEELMSMLNMELVDEK